MAPGAGTTLNDYELVFVSDVGSTYNTFDLADASWTFTDEGGGFGYFVIGIVNPGEGTGRLHPGGLDQQRDSERARGFGPTAPENRPGECALPGLWRQ